MAQLAEIERGMLVLEPSAGMGALCDAITTVEPSAIVRCCEIDPIAAKRLRMLPNINAVAGCDFLELEPGVSLYDRVVMNPPFTRGQDIAHVTHALKFLRPGGRLVALTSSSWRWASTKAADAFRELVAEADLEEVPAETFKASGTNIATILLTIREAKAASKAA